MNFQNSLNELLPNNKSGYVAIAIDTSGGMAVKTLEKLWSIVEWINEKYEKIKVIQCDTIIQEVKDYTKINFPKFVSFKGRGGTLFSPVFTYLNSLPEPPSCLIYMTDLVSIDKPEKPDYEVIWMIPENDKYEMESFVPFGASIKLQEEE